jgi:hypothetical protein
MLDASCDLAIHISSAHEIRRRDPLDTVSRHGGDLSPSRDWRRISVFRLLDIAAYRRQSLYITHGAALEYHLVCLDCRYRHHPLDAN